MTKVVRCRRYGRYSEKSILVESFSDAIESPKGKKQNPALAKAVLYDENETENR